MIKRFLRIIIKSLLGILGVWIGLLLILEIALSPAVTSKVVKKVAAEYVDGNLDFSKVRISMFKRFPSFFVEIDDFCLTYPADRFDEAEKEGARSWMMRQGCGQESDTLASFKSFKASVRMIPLISGNILVPYMNLDKPRVFAHSYDNGESNWNMFRIGETEETEDETVKESGTYLSLGKISLNNNPHIVYTDSRDTLFAMLRLRNLDFKGRIANRKLSHNNIALKIDSLFVAGRTGSDTLAFGMQSLDINEKGKNIDLHMDARTLLATKALGRLNVPILIDGSVSFPRDSVFAVSVERFNANIATIPIEMAGDVRFHEDGLYIGADARINRCSINGLLRGLAKNIVPEADKISTDASLTLDAHCNGKYIYETGQLPFASISVEIPQSRISHKALSEDISLALDVKADVDEAGQIHAKINRTDISTTGVGLKLSGSGSDLLGADPELKIKGSLHAVLKDLMTFVPDSLGIAASGDIKADLEGDALLSQLNLYKFSEAKLNGEIKGSEINVNMPSDELDAYIRALNIKLGPEDQKSRRDSTVSWRMLAFRGNIDSLSLAYGNLKAKGRDISITAKSSADALSGDKEFHHVGGSFRAQSLSADDGAGARIMLRETSNSFRVSPDKENAKIPILTFTSRNKMIAAKIGTNRAGLKDAKIIASATLNKKKEPEGKQPIFRRGNMKRRNQDDDFRNQDINIRLDDELARYFREWDFRGSMKIEGGFIASPYFPLRNRLKGLHGRFNSNELTLKEFSVASGKSDIRAEGKLSGYRRMFGGEKGGKLNLNLNISSDNIDADELLRAYNAGIRYEEQHASKALEGMSDEQYQEAIAIDSTSSENVQMATIVIPGNLNAELRLDSRNIKYTDLQIDSLKAKAIIKDRCVQITETEARSNMGNIGFNGFYASLSKEDIKAGFSVDFKNITAEKVISLMPAIDTLMPMLKSFHGLLNCEIAATSQLDTNMNLLMPSISGIMRITGDNLAIKNDAVFQSLAKKLLFKNKKEGKIDHMSVEGVIADNVVEVFPFVLQMDRYTLAMSGIQNLDMSFKYHISLIKSPFLIKLGLDVYGSDFDHMKFHIGRAKYRDPEVPVFSKVIDDTKINLVSSIENIFKKGVDAAIREHNEVDLIRKRKKELNYVSIVDQKMEALSEDEQKKVAEEEARQQAEEQETEKQE